MIRIVIVDDHPALRAGLRTVLESEPGFVFAGESSGEDESVWPTLHTTRPDLVLMDYHLPRGDGLQLCYRIKQEIPAPSVLMFSAYASADLALPALMAGADGLLSKAVGARELFEAIRRVDGGERLVEAPSAGMIRDATGRLTAGDRAIVGMLLASTGEGEIATTLRLARRDVRHVVLRTLRELRRDRPVV